MSAPRIILNPRRASPFYGRHPWVYAGAISRIEGTPADGDEVDVHAHDGGFIARGLFNGRSRIRVRLYAWQADQPLDKAFFRERLEHALRLRRDVLGLTGPGKAARLVFSEGDFLSGLTVDQYDRWLVVQFTSLAMAQRKEMWVELLREAVEKGEGGRTKDEGPSAVSSFILPPSSLVEGMYLRTERGIGKLEGLELQDGPLWGKVPDGPVVIDENGVAFEVNVAEGHKTGFYLDQRDNRRVVARLARGRRMLDAFCYTGGFGLHATRAGASEVIGVDSSAIALQLARRNAERNGLSASFTFVESDVFEYLEKAARAGERFGLIVLDPPKFARAAHAVEDALRGYRRLQTVALLLLEPGGILATCCCSGLITWEMLETLSGQVAAKSKRHVHIIERRGQPADHPVAVSCLESSYLKCLITRLM